MLTVNSKIPIPVDNFFSLERVKLVSRTHHSNYAHAKNLIAFKHKPMTLSPTFTSQKDNLSVGRYFLK
jgi:hypothetical protein